MLWVPLLRLDQDDAAGTREAKNLVAAVRPVLEALDENPVAHLNIALTVPALDALAAHAPRELDMLLRVASRRLVEFVGTPAYGALLPMLPPGEIVRQLRLGDEAGRARFGTPYRPGALWPTGLAVSPRVLQVAADEGFPAVLVDERAMRTPDGLWPGARIDAAAGHPGLFLLPVSRRGSRAMWVSDVGGLDQLVLHPRMRHPRYVITSTELRGRTGESPYGLVDGLRRRRTLRIQDLLEHFPKVGVTAPLPSSQEASDEALAHGMPLWPWLTPGMDRTAARTELMTALVKSFESLAAGPAGALNALRRLRGELDHAWRAERWRTGDDADLRRLDEEVRRLRATADRGLRAHGASV